MTAKKDTDFNLLSRLYDLALSKDISEDERAFVLQAKRDLEAGREEQEVLSYLSGALRPGAIKRTLTKPLSQFYVDLHRDPHKVSDGIAKGIIHAAWSLGPLIK